MIKKIFEITGSIINGKGFCPGREDIEDIFNENTKDIEDILYCSDKIRKHNKKNSFFVCSIINAKSGKCSQDCAFCAQSSFHNTGVKEYPLLPAEQIVQKALEMEEKGATRFSIVTSGLKLSDQDTAIVCKAAEEIKNKTSLIVCGSLGMLNHETAKRLYSSGISRYHHNLETARSHFDNICTTHKWEDDINTIKCAAETGFDVCAGAIFGMGETWKQRVEFAYTLRELPVEAIPVNFLTPVKGTKLENLDLLSVHDALLTIAMLRTVLPEKSITICGGRETVLKDYQSWIFRAGADGIMAGNYLTIKGRAVSDDLTMLKDLYSS